MSQPLPPLPRIHAKAEHRHPGHRLFENVIRPLAYLHNEVQGEIDGINMLQYAATDLETQEASVKAHELYMEAKTSWRRRDDLFQLIKAVKDKGEDLDHESKLWLSQELLDYTLLGHGTLNGSQIEELAKERLEIDALASKFRRNMISTDAGLWFTEEELDGVPADTIAKLRKGDGEKRFLSLGGGDIFSVLRFAKNPETRMRASIANETKLPENAEIFRTILLQRDNLARRLGYSSHAAYRIERMVAKSPEWIQDFLEKMKAGLVPRAKAFVDKLQAQRINDLKERGLFKDGDEESFPPWDYRYYFHQLQLTANVDQSKISDFFPMEQAASAMIAIFAKYFQLRFEPVAVENLNDKVLWHEDIQVWAVWDDKAADSFTGYLYLDLLERDNKPQRYCSLSLREGYLKPDGTREYPCTILLCPFPKAVATGSALLTHAEVVLMFHELGHGIHDLLAKTKYVRHHGTRLPDDICETPSVMLETWTWRKDILRQISCHYTASDSNEALLLEWRLKNPGQPDPPKQIPDDLLDSLLAERNTNRINVYIQQLELAIFDMKVHNPGSHDELVNLDISALCSQLRTELRGLKDPQGRDFGGYPYPNFPSIVNGYDASMYGYVSAATYAEDLFRAVFAADPEDLDAWDRYRRGILEFGGSHGDEIRMIEDVLGRPLNMSVLGESLE